MRVYFNYDNDESWNADDFVVYELKDGTDFWQACQLSNIEQINGHMTMDIVADISSSMDDQFVTMKNNVVNFTNSTASDTYLGLSTIGSVYTREQAFTQDKNVIRNSVNSLECYGRTSLYQSLYSSVLYTATASGSRCVVAFTDGKNEPYGTGYDYEIDDVISVSQTYQIPIYVIGIGYYVDSSALREIAEETGGFYKSISSVSDLSSIYQEIYERQQKTYQLTYQSSLPNNTNRQIYVYGGSVNGNVQVRVEQDIEAETLSNAYSASAEGNLLANDLAGYYTDEFYLSQIDLRKITDPKEIQTIINIYFAKNGFEFGNEDVLNEMIRLGVISQNGIRTSGEALNSIMSNPTVYRNFMALYNYRYELFYNIGYDVYFNEGIRDETGFVNRICAIINETNTSRFMDIRRVYSALAR